MAVNNPYTVPAAPGPGYAPGPAGPPPGPAGPYGGPQANPYGAPGYPPGLGPSPLGFQGGPGPVPPGAPRKSRPGLWIALGVAALLLVGGGVAAALAAGGDDTAAGTTTTGTGVTASTAVGGSTQTSLIGPGSSVTDGGGFFFGEDGLADVASCTRVDDEKMEIDLTNHSSKVVDYFLTVVLEDTPGQRVADTSAFIEAVRPNEHVVEETYIFEDKGSTCQVIQAQRTETTNDASLVGDVSACTVGEPDILGDVSATLTVTNSASANSDYSVTVSFLDDKGVRRGTGYASIEAVRPGEKAPGDVFTTVPAEGVHTCDVVAVNRSPS
ncbi:MAG: hypothetical protein OEW29_01810 [Acidimicrobiia bacterium]|nr:hypothetical protein [Acidimicrobiia bacterium]MDH4362789.1 hypothetical protein [Acidimicrobiia bacterium]